MIAEWLKEIAERAAKATPGPWDWTPGEWEKVDGGEQQITGAFLTPYEAGIDCGEFMAIRDNDAEFMAHSRTDIPDLLAHIQALEEANAKLREVLVSTRNHIYRTQRYSKLCNCANCRAIEALNAVLSPAPATTDK